MKKHVSILEQIKTSKVEPKWIEEHYSEFDDFRDMLIGLSKPRKEGGGTANVRRKEKIESLVKTLDNSQFNQGDTPHEIAWKEYELLGVSLTYSKTECCEVNHSNVTCREVLDGYHGYVVLGVEINTVREYKVSRGKNKGSIMAFLTVSDETCALDNIVVFSNKYKDFENLLYEGNTVLLHCHKDTKKNSLRVEGVWQLK